MVCGVVKWQFRGRRVILDWFSQGATCRCDARPTLDQRPNAPDFFEIFIADLGTGVFFKCGGKRNLDLPGAHPRQRLSA